MPSFNYDRLCAGLAHLSGFLLPIFVPLILWQTLQQRMPFAARHAKQAFYFQTICYILISLTTAVLSGIDFVGGLPSIVDIVARFLFSQFFNSGSGDTVSLGLAGAGLILFLIANLLGILLPLMASIYMILAGIRGFQGKTYHYPFLGHL